MIMEGEDARRQPYRYELAEELEQILLDSPCIVATPKSHAGEYWAAFDETEWSSFVSRPDEAPWIDREDYWDKVISLWRYREVILVRGRGSLEGWHLEEAKSVKELVCPDYDAWADIEEIEQWVLQRPSEIVIICLGATATVLSDRLTRKGRWAVDLGSIGNFQGISGNRAGRTRSRP